MDVVGGFLLADSTQVKALTGVDDHSRFWVSARLMPRERTRPVCEGLAAALGRYGPPEQILTDNAKVFTGRFFAPPAEVLFDPICRQNGRGPFVEILILGQECREHQRSRMARNR
jgi:hypothetical protein